MQIYMVECINKIDAIGRMLINTMTFIFSFFCSFTEIFDVMYMHMKYKSLAIAAWIVKAKASLRHKSMFVPKIKDDVYKTIISVTIINTTSNDTLKMHDFIFTS